MCKPFIMEAMPCCDASSTAIWTCTGILISQHIEVLVHTSSVIVSRQLHLYNIYTPLSVTLVILPAPDRNPVPVIVTR